jgi:hypothetical protein
MAKQEFLDHFRVARNLFIHAPVEADNPHVDPAAAAQRLVRAAVWLTPKSVKGFSADDFPELGPDRQRELQAAAQAFLDVAQEVPPDRAATAEQYRDAAIAFGKMLEILQPYLPAPDEGEKLARALRSVELPPWVVNWDYELGRDDTGGPAVWVNLVADQSAATPAEFGRLASRLTQKLLQALSAAGVSRWPYIRVRTAAEYKSV